ncbi:hypothetical protein Tco_1363344 [Tanacetum coccineum]
MSIKEMEDLKQQCLDETQSISNQIQIKDYRNEKIDIRYRRECEIMIDELTGKFNGMSIEINKKKELRQLEQAANLSTYTTEPSRRFNSFYDDDGFTKGGSPRTLHHDGMRILALVSGKGIEEFLTSSVEELVPIPSDVNPLFDEVLEDIESKDSYISKLGGEIDEIDAFLDIDVPTDIEDDYYDSEGDIIYLKSLLIKDTTHNLTAMVIFRFLTEKLKDDPDNYKI